MAVRERSAVQVKSDVFDKKYVKACDAGQTLEEFADSIGMKHDSCRARISALRSQYRKETANMEDVPEFPELKASEGGGRAVTKKNRVSNLLSLMSSYDDDEVSDEDDSEAGDEVEEGAETANA